MRHRLVLAFFVGFIVLIASISPAPAAAQNLLPTPTCGLGQYWLVQDNGWDSVWIRREDSTTFDALSAFWMQPDGSATLNIDLEGDAVFIDRVDTPNIFGTQTCSYQGTVRPDGVSVVGSVTCQLDTGISRALSWSAIIICGPPLVTWNDTTFWHRAAKSHRFSFECPPDGIPAPIWGTGVYIEGSSICTAAVHAGAITLADGGLVVIEILPGEASYPGSTQNGIFSDNFNTPGQFDASFRILGGKKIPQESTSTPTPDATSTGQEEAEGEGGGLGRWESDDFGTIEIISEGVGAYNQNGEPSNLYFAYENSRTITGYWVEVSSFRDCGVEREGSRYWGRIRIVFDAEFSTFTGTWGYCDDEPTAEWSGYRLVE